MHRPLGRAVPVGDCSSRDIAEAPAEAQNAQPQANGSNGNFRPNERHPAAGGHAAPGLTESVDVLSSLLTTWEYGRAGHGRHGLNTDCARRQRVTRGNAA